MMPLAATHLFFCKHNMQAIDPACTQSNYGQRSCLLRMLLLSCRRHKLNERPAVMKTLAACGAASSAGSDSVAGGCVDGPSRMIVVSWLVEVAEEFGLQQESLHGAVTLLDAFLAASAVRGLSVGSSVVRSVGIAAAAAGVVGLWKCLEQTSS
jgi:hypothetical protein